MTTQKIQNRLDYLTVQMKRLVNGEKLSSDSLQIMLYHLELLSSYRSHQKEEGL
jgi:hypothetical protein